MIDEKILKNEEKAVFALRSLYGKYGYTPYKMSKFEEYDFYIHYKDFLVSDRLIAFNDTNGKLMALKPDVSLSIIKNAEDLKGIKQKVFYNENVYRVSGMTNKFKEIMQTGLECIGDIDMYDIFEVISLAAESLSLIDEAFCVEVSHLGIVSGIINSVCSDYKFFEEAINCIKQKNIHDLKNICESYRIPSSGYEKICGLVNAYGDREKVISALKEISDIPEIEEMEKLSRLLNSSPHSEKIKFDFSVISNMNYYNGFVFKGFLDGIYDMVLAGGQYDTMMKKMNRSSGAVGFAIYLDMLEQLKEEQKQYDLDYLLLYDDTVDAFEVSSCVNSLIASGYSVNAQKNVSSKLRYKKLRDLRKR